jgi:hypothetical protein
VTAVAASPSSSPAGVSPKQNHCNHHSHRSHNPHRLSKEGAEQDASEAVASLAEAVASKKRRGLAKAKMEKRRVVAADGKEAGEGKEAVMVLPCKDGGDTAGGRQAMQKETDNMASSSEKENKCSGNSNPRQTPPSSPTAATRSRCTLCRKKLKLFDVASGVCRCGENRVNVLQLVCTPAPQLLLLLAELLTKTDSHLSLFCLLMFLSRGCLLSNCL